MAERKHVIWSNCNLNLDDWRDDLKENNPDMSEDELYCLMVDTNNDYFEDTIAELDIDVPNGIIAIGDLGLWDGRRQGYKDVRGNISGCFCGDCDYMEWYVDGQGDLRATAVHHDGTNYYLYRAFKEGVSECQKNKLRNLLYYGMECDKEIKAYTSRIGDIIGDVFGWAKFPGRRPSI